MFYSESLLTREGPLAQVWLAANLERKLSKTQFLQSNISQSTEAIVRATTHSSESEALALRLSGQLLYGVVRIYSRKAKYLLDDVSDALLKIKSAFKSSSNAITLPVNATIVPSMNQLILQDTVTQGDLLYQEPLIFDDEPQQKRGVFFATQNVSQDADESIEMPRNRFGDDIDELPHDDGVDIELNFDLDQDQDEDDDEERLPQQQQEDEVNDHNDEPIQYNDQGGWVPDDDFAMGDGEIDDYGYDDDSVEVGRAVDDANLSQVMNESTQGIDLGFDNFDQPLETIDDIEDEEHEHQLQLIEPPKQKKRRTVTKQIGKKIINDRTIELEVSAFSDTSSTIVASPSSQSSTASVTLENKRAYVDFLLNDKFMNKRLADRFFSITPSKRVKIVEPEIRSPEPELPELQSDRGDDEADYQDHNDFGMDMDFDFDGGEDLNRVPIDSPHHPGDESLGVIEERVVSEDEELHEFPQTQSGVSESTGIVESQIGELLETEEFTTFTNVIEKNSESEQSLAQQPKSEATRVFFELLVLATGDKVALKQNELFGEISISSISI